jgi:hypothetical protein
MLRISLIACSLFLLIPGLSSASQWTQELERAVLTSELIVLGTLADVSYSTTQTIVGDRSDGIGFVKIHRVLWGDISPERPLTLGWSRLSPAICPVGRPPFNPGTAGGQLGIWILQLSDTAGVCGAGRKCFLPADSLGLVQEVFSQHPVVLRSRPGYATVDGAEPLPFWVHFRNASDHEARFPGIAVTDTSILLDSRLSFEFGYADLPSPSTFAGIDRPACISADTLEVIVPSGREYVV